MDVKWVVLWTDAVFFALIVSAITVGFFSLKQKHKRMAWQKVFSNRLGMFAFVVLSCYGAIAVLDSIHFQRLLDDGLDIKTRHYSVHTESLLDVALGSPEKKHEKTYSAPFALHSFSSAAAGGANNIQHRLLYAGTHLTHISSKGYDIFLKSSYALAIAFGLFFIIIMGFLVILSFYKKISIKQSVCCLFAQERKIAWRTLFLAIFSVLSFASVILVLSHHYHILGTDKVGEDVFYQAVKSIRTGLFIGLFSTITMLPIALSLGIMAGYFKGWIDDVIQYVYTTLSSIPGVLLIAAAVLVLRVFISNHSDWFYTIQLRADARLLALCFILGVTSWTGLCRLLRAETLKIRELEYVQAARVLGIRDSKILWAHILPNVMHIVLIALAMDFSGLVLTEAVLSYVGVGVDPTMMSWGNMINQARLELAREPVVWWSLLAAFCFMFILVLAANLFADAIRDGFDPRTEQSNA